MGGKVAWSLVGIEIWGFRDSGFGIRREYFAVIGAKPDNISFFRKSTWLVPACARTT